MLLSRLWYYATSLPAIIRGFRNWPVFFGLLVGLPRRRPVGIRLRDTGLVFRVRTALEAWVLKEVVIDREYEAASVTIQDGWTVVDVGAGIGDFAIDIARREPGCSVIACEPNPDTFAVLCENVAANGVENVRAYPYAIGTGARDSTTLQPRSDPVKSTTDGRDGIDVPVRSLERLMRDAGLRRIDFLKLDCEGCEFEVVLALERGTLERIGVLCLEYHETVAGRSHEELVFHLRHGGFRTAVVPSPVHRGLGLIGAIRPELAQQVDASGL